MDMLKLCTKCKNTNEETFHGYIGWVEEDLYECPICQGKMTDTIITIDEYQIIDNISEDINFLESMIDLKEKDPIEYQLKMNQFKTQLEQKKTTQKQQSNTKQVKCPKCGSTSISTGARGVNHFWGFIGASKTVNRCANCGHTWKPNGK
jgi:hypothetical protein